MYALIERLRMKFQQLTDAVIGGDDFLVHLLDRDIERSTHALFEMRPTSPREFYHQLRFAGELVLQDAGDAHSVRLRVTALLHLLDRSFQRAGLDIRRRVAPPLARREEIGFDDAYLYQAMLDAMNEQVVLVGRDCRVIYANRTFSDAHHRRPLECIGRHFHEFEFRNGLPPDFDRRVAACFDREPERAENQAPGSASRDLAAIDVKPLFVGRGPAVGVMVTFRQFAMAPVTAPARG